MPNGWHRKNENTPQHRARRKRHTSPEHRKAKIAGQQTIDAGRGFCWRCHRHIPPGTPGNGWHVGHDDHNANIIRGVECVSCNLHAAAVAGARARNRTQHPHTTPRPNPSQPW